MSAARMPADQKRRLALVQGGRAHAEAGDGDGDWDDFCHRIGWQGPAPEADDDLEKRIAEGLFSKPIEDEDEDDNVIDLDLARTAAGARDFDARSDLYRSGTHEIDPALVHEIRRSFVREALLSPVSERRPAIFRDTQEHEIEDEEPSGVLSRAAPRAGDVALSELAPDATRKPVSWARVALTLGLAAAVLLAVTRLAISPARSPSASIPLPSAESAHAATAEPRMVDAARSDALHLDAPQPTEVAPVRAAPPEQPTARPSPRAKTPHVQPKGPRDASPEPPGALVARRASEAPVRGHRPAVDRPASSGSRGVELARSAVAAGDALATGGWTVARATAAPSAPWATAAHYPLALSAREAPAPAKLFHSALGATDRLWRPAPQAPVTEVWSKGSSAEGWGGADRARPGQASWSLSGGKNRWVGASLTPSPSDAPANVGAMVQLDLGKALDKL